MAQYVRDQNGLIHEVPDEATPEMIAEAFGVKYGNEQEQVPSQFAGFSVDQSKPIANTIFGKMPQLQQGSMPSKEMIDEMINFGVGAPGIANVAGKIASTVGGAGSSVAKTAMQLPEIVTIMKQKINPRDLITKIQQGHDKLDKYATGLYENIKNIVKDRNIGEIKVSDEYKQLLDKTKKYMPEDEEVQNLYDEAKKGSYSAFHKLQSFLGSRSRDLKKAKDITDRDKGRYLYQDREKIIDYVKNHFKNIGHPDIADKMQEARESYKSLHDIYYPTAEPAIGRIVDLSKRKIPKNPLSFLTTESTSMDRLFAQHPEIKEQVDILKKQQEINKKLKKAAPYLGGAAAFTAIEGGKSLLDLLTGI